MDLRLLGPVEVRLDDRPIELGPRKQRAVLAMLALQVGRTVSADRLVEGLWGEHPPSSAPKMVQLYISHLRPLLDGSGARIVTRERRLRAAAPDGEVDAVRFERLLEESRAREALALWHGDALADVADEPFAAAEIRRLDELRLRAAESAIDERPGGGPARRGDRRARGARGRRAAARAPARAAHARAVPLRPPVGRARGLPRRALGARRADRRRARGRAAAAAGRDPRPGPRARRARGGRGGAGDRAAAAAARAREAGCWSPPPSWSSPA